jgi:hypothetical protein
VQRSFWRPFLHCGQRGAILIPLAVCLENIAEAPCRELVEQVRDDTGFEQMKIDYT